MRAVFTFASWVLAVSSAFGQLPSNATGSICGLVVDENGAPAAHVRVTAMILSPAGHTGGYPVSQTDEAGHYCIQRLELGLYIMSADDKAKGYPQRGTGFFSWSAPDPEVLLTSQNPSVRSDWQIPFKAGFLKLDLTSVQAESIDLITFKFVVRSRPKLGLETVTIPVDTEHKVITLLVPPDEDVLLTVASPGHQNWPDDGARLVNVPEGATQNLVIPTLQTAP